MKNLGKIDEGKIIVKRAGVGDAALNCIKIQVLAILMIFVVSMITAFVAHAETINKDVSELTMNFLDRNNGVYEWTGEQIKPRVDFNTASGSGLNPEGVRLEYGENVELGKGTITVIGLGEEGTDWQYKWYGTKTFEFTIVKTVNPLVNTGYIDGDNAICGSYHDGFVFSNDLKKLIKDTIDESSVIKSNFSNEIKNAVSKNDLKFTSSDKNIFKVDKNKNSITVTGVGIAYLNFTIPETEHFKSFNGKIRIESYPPDSNSEKLSNQLEPGNKIRYGVTCGKDTNKCKTDFKCKVIIATNKSFKKSSIIKSYTLNKKDFNKQKIKKIKSKKFKKGKKFYIKRYTYKKLSDGRTMYGEGYIDCFKISKKGRIDSVNIGKNAFITTDPYIE